MKIIKWIWDNILFAATLFLLAFIPLFPKRPLIDIEHTWVYIRGEDFVVVLFILVWIVLLLRKKVKLQTPLTLPIILFWIIGGIATIHGVLLIFPTLANVFPNVAFLSFLRRIEYLSLFFIAFSGMKDKRYLPYVIALLTITLFLVFGYGIGQKYFGFPAFLTMNEEFAKGNPIRLSEAGRVPSTFAGHYDLAAYLVLVIPILTSMIFGVKNWLGKAALFIAVSCGFILLFMTVSRVSFFVLLISLFGILLFQKKKFVVFSLPIVIILFSFLFFRFAPSLMDRYGSTVKETDVMVDAKTGEVIGNSKKVNLGVFENKVIKRKVFQGRDQLTGVYPSKEDMLIASPSARVLVLPSELYIVAPPNISTGENLPQGTGYINLSLSPVVKRLGEFFYEIPNAPVATNTAQITMFEGNFLIKRASAYDLSFTTRFQGEWPHALQAFKRNILFGSGYSSVSLSIDNNYLRILGEIGVLGFISFIAIFVVLGIYIKKILPQVDSPLAKSFILGFGAGVFGLALNAFLIDVFEASKIAFSLWLLTGVTVGLLSLYQIKDVELFKEFKKAITSNYAVTLYLLIIVLIVFSPMASNYFVSDDYTWLRWIADCTNNSTFVKCPPTADRVSQYFFDSDGFFYRPGTKIFFLMMYSVFWLNQNIYHMVSISLHFIVSVLVFLLAKKVLKNLFFSFLAAFLFLILSGYSEAVFWISSIGFLFTAVFALLSLYLFIQWKERKKTVYFIVSLFSLIFSFLFHEMGIVTPFLIILYAVVYDEQFSIHTMVKKIHYGLLLLPIPLYLAIRFLSQSHWFSGDYNYNLLKLPFNFIGNALGYLLLDLFGPLSLSFYLKIRNYSKEHIFFAAVLSILIGVIVYVTYRYIVKRVEKDDKKILAFGFFFFIIALLPFLGLGNITSRYSYLSSVGFILLFAFFIKKISHFLRSSGKDIALAGTTIVITVFFLLHIMQIQQIHGDWYEAGEKAKRFFTSVEGYYADYWTKEPLKFYFVNVPERTGEAWVFRVGLKDALWFSFQNPNLAVYQTSLQEALNSVDGSANQKVFEFDDNGRVIERKKLRNAR